MNVFFVRVWLDGSNITAVQTDEVKIPAVGLFQGDGTYVDAVGIGTYVTAATLRPTLSYTNNVLSSSLVTLYPAKDVIAMLAADGYTGQQVYNWNDDNFYQWNGFPWESVFSKESARSIADESFNDAIEDAVIPYDNFADDAKGLIEGIQAEIEGYLNGYEGDVQSLTLADMTSLSADIAGTYTSTATLTSDYYTIAGADVAISAAITSFESTFIGDNDLATNAAVATAYYTKAQTDSVVSSSISSLSASIAGNYATLSQVATIEGDVTGIEGKYGITIDANNRITGFQLLNGTGGSAFNLRVDQFRLYDSSNNGGVSPFTIFTSPRTINGITYPAGTYIRDAYIDTAAIVKIDAAKINIDNSTIATSGGVLFVKDRGISSGKIGLGAVEDANIGFNQVNNDHIDDAAVDTAQIASLAVTKADDFQDDTPGGLAELPGNGAYQTVIPASGIAVPGGSAASILFLTSFQQGYTAGAKTWGFRLYGKLGSSSFTSGDILLERSGMTAIADFPTVQTLVETISTVSSSTYYIRVDWYGQDSTIKLQKVITSTFFRYR